MSASPGDFVLQLLQSAPHSAALSLAGQKLSSAQLQAIVPVLQKFQALTELDLADNALQHVEALGQLTHLHRIDVSANPALSASDVASSVAKLSNLRHLSVPVRDADDELQALRRLQQLHTFNGEDAPARLLLCEQRHASAAAPSGGQVARSNSDVSQAAAPAKSSGPLAAPDINLVAADLEPVATLFDAIRSLLPAAELNATAPASNASPAEVARHTALRLDTFESHINGAVVALNDRLGAAPYSSSSTLRHGAILAAKQSLFDICARGLAAHARVVHGSAMADAMESLRAAEDAIRAKHMELLAYTDQEMQSLALDRARLAESLRIARADKDHAVTRAASDLASVRSALEAAQQSSQASLQKIQSRLDSERDSAKEKKALVDLVDTLDRENASLKEEMARGSAASSDAGARREKSLQEALANREKYWMEREAAWQVRIDAAQQSVAFEQQQAQQSQQQQQQSHHFTPQQTQNQGRGGAAPSSNDQFDSPQQQQQDDDASSIAASSLHPQHQSGPSSRLHPSAPFTSSDAALPNTLPSTHFHPSTTSHALALHQHTQAQMQHGGGKQHAPLHVPSAPPAGGRSMTLRQLKDLIGEIYLSFDLLSKSWITSHNLRQESTKETLLQHMYTFLEVKFGLRSLIIDAAQALLKGITDPRHGRDHTVAVFAAILKHQIDYPFHLVESKTRRTVKELLKRHLAQRYPLKRDHALQEMLKERTTAAGGMLSEEEYSAVVEYMFAPVDRAPILTTIRTLLRQNQLREIARAREAAFTAASRLDAEAQLAALESSAAAARLPIPYSTFVNVLLDFQLHVHRQFLAPFVARFRALDTVHSGLLSYDQFAALLAELNPALSDADIRERIHRADPFGHRLVSFSDCVACMGDELRELARRTHATAIGAQQEARERQAREADPLGEQRAHERRAQEWASARERRGSSGSIGGAQERGSGEDFDDEQGDESAGLSDSQSASYSHSRAPSHSQHSHSHSFDPAHGTVVDEYDVPKQQTRQAFHVHGQ